MASQTVQRSRPRDGWRWLAVLPLIGGLGAIVVALRRRRLAWAAALVLVTVAECVCFGVAGRAAHGRANGTWVGLGVLLWLTVLGLCWAFPTAEERPAAPWPAVTDRARALTARYGLIAYGASFGGTVALALLLRAAGVRLGIGLGVIVVDVVLLATLVPLWRSGRLGRRDLGLCTTRPGTSALLAVGTLILYLGLSVVWALVVIGHSGSSASLTKQFNIAAHPGTLTTILDVFAIAVCAPVCEEIFFRGLLFRCLRNRLPLWAAALIAGCLFGLVHITNYPLNTIPIKMLFGVLMCLLYERTGSLLPGMAVHAFVDGAGADLIFSGNITIALIAAVVVLAVVAGRVLVVNVRDYTPPPRYVPASPPAPAEPGAPWPPHLRDS